MGEGRTGRCLASDEGVDIHEVVLLGLIEDAVYRVHADGWGSTQIEYVVEGRPNFEDECSDGSGDFMVDSMEDVYEGGPGVQFLSGDLRSGRIEDFCADEAISVCKAHG